MKPFDLVGTHFSADPSGHRRVDARLDFLSAPQHAVAGLAGKKATRGRCCELKRVITLRRAADLKRIDAQFRKLFGLIIVDLKLQPPPPLVLQAYKFALRLQQQLHLLRC